MFLLHLPQLLLELTGLDLLLNHLNLLSALLFLNDLLPGRTVHTLLLQARLLPSLLEIGLQLAHFPEHGLLEEPLRVSLSEGVLCLLDHSCLEKPDGLYDVDPAFQLYLCFEALWPFSALGKRQLELNGKAVSVGEALVSHETSADDRSGGDEVDIVRNYALVCLRLHELRLFRHMRQGQDVLALQGPVFEHCGVCASCFCLREIVWKLKLRY